MAFRIEIHTGKEWQVEQNGECIISFHIAGWTGVWIVNALLWLNWLPAATAPWKCKAAKWFHDLDDLQVKSYNRKLKDEGWNWTKYFELSCRQTLPACIWGPE